MQWSFATCRDCASYLLTASFGERHYRQNSVSIELFVNRMGQPFRTSPACVLGGRPSSKLFKESQEVSRSFREFRGVSRSLEGFSRSFEEFRGVSKGFRPVSRSFEDSRGVSRSLENFPCSHPAPHFGSGLGCGYSQLLAFQSPTLGLRWVVC